MVLSQNTQASTIPLSPGASNLANVGFPQEEASALAAADTTVTTSDSPYNSLPQIDVSKEDDVTGIIDVVEVEEAKGGKRGQLDEEPSAAGSVWQRTRPRVRFYTHQVRLTAPAPYRYPRATSWRSYFLCPVCLATRISLFSFVRRVVPW